jgi:hypothetical protein
MTSGQASGTKAGMAVKHDISLRKVDYRALHTKLVEQGVTLTGVTLTAVS